MGGTACGLQPPVQLEPLPAAAGHRVGPSGPRVGGRNGNKPTAKGRPLAHNTALNSLWLVGETTDEGC